MAFKVYQKFTKKLEKDRLNWAFFHYISDVWKNKSLKKAPMHPIITNNPIPKLGYWLIFLLVSLVSACQQAPVSDMRLFSERNTSTSKVEQYLDTIAINSVIQKLPKKSLQVDSLLTIVHQLKDYDYETTLYYANQAYELATEGNWDLQRGISLYYIALMKRRIQTWGGGIEDALVDAEMSQIIFERLGRKDWEVIVLNLIGIIHLRQYEEDRPLKLDSARAYMYKALAVFEETDLAQEDSIALHSELLHALGTSYFIDNLDSAMIFYQLALTGNELINNQSNIYRIKNDIAEIFLEKRKLEKADSILQECLEYGLYSKHKQVLSDTYLHLSDLQIIRYRQTENPLLFEKGLEWLYKRLALSTNDQYYTYQRIGYAHNRKALIFYAKFLDLKTPKPDSATLYRDWAYQHVDSTVWYYKLAMDDARSKGVLTVMDNLMLNIYNNCIDKQLEKKGDCEELFGKNTAAYLRESYKIVADLMTVNLTDANHRIRKIEKLEGERISSSKRRTLLLYSFMALLVTGLISLLFLQRSKQRKLRAQMEALRAQINPHFMSNSLNAIESLVNLGQNEAASKYLIHFSRLSRRILNSSRNPNTSLAEELKTLEHFLKLEQLRFRDKLSYKIEVSDGLQTELIKMPAMILQPYIENAIWHGIKPKDGLGMLTIRIERNGKHLVCMIEDNGIGREKAKELQANSMLKHKSHGMKINEERLKAIGKAKNSKVEIIDLQDTNGAAMGTRILIRLPFKLIKGTGKN